MKVAVFPKPSSVKTEFGTYNFSIPEVLGIEKAKDIKEILVVPRGDIQVLKYDLIKMKDSKDPKKEISYTKLLLSGDINGEIIRVANRNSKSVSVPFRSLNIKCHNNNWQYCIIRIKEAL